MGLEQSKLEVGAGLVSGHVEEGLVDGRGEVGLF